MHQPSYRSPLTGQYTLPWVLLHAMRDYYDMPALAASVDGIRPVFNLVPGLLAQLEDYTEKRASDAFLQVALKDPPDLTVQEKQFLVDNFFLLHPETMIKPFPRYSELADKARTYVAGESPLPRFSDQELCDLQVWYFLAWTGRTLRQDERVKALFDKGRDFTPGDKQQLSHAVLDLLSRTIPHYRDLLAAQRIDVSCSPMYHPILPLLINSGAAREAVPDIRLPAGLFGFPEDAVRQVEQGVKFVSERMGRRITGMWPSEGSVSTEALRILGSCGISWIATDEKMLAATLREGMTSRPDAIYTPWMVGQTAVFFRDATLSDLPGFVYSRWKPDAAVRHFVQELARAAASTRHERPVITVAMDGENAWEYYLHGGDRFLELLYRTLAADERFEVVSPETVLAESPQLLRLDRLAAGSWIDGTFRTWIGDPVKNRAWEHLLSARNAVASHLQRNNAEPAARDELMDLMMRAEASDWFWWFGEGHSSRYDVEFDALFREHLKAIYERLALQPPPALDRPLDPDNADACRCDLPVHLISPVITGREDSYYKWLSAGSVEAQQGFSHRPDLTVRGMRFGFDLKKVYFKVTAVAPFRQLMEEKKLGVEFHFSMPGQRHLRIQLDKSGRVRALCADSGEDCPGVEVAVESVMEVAIPFELLGAADLSRGANNVIDVHLVLRRRGKEVERFPGSTSVVFTLRGEELDAENWHA